MSLLTRDLLAPFRRRSSPAARAPLAEAGAIASRRPAPKNRLPGRIRRRRDRPACGVAERLERRLALAIDVTPITGNGFFYIDTTQGRDLNSQYSGYRIFNNTTTTYDDVWVLADNFSGGAVDLAPNEDGVYYLGRLDDGEIDRAWFFLTAVGDSPDPQSHDVTLYAGNPLEGGTPIGGPTTITFNEVIQTIEAENNKVDSAVYDTDSPVLGGLITMTVKGNLGQAGGDSVLFSPDTRSSWRPDVYELESITITIEGTNARVVTDELYLTGFAQESNNPYTAEYTFRLVDVIATETPVSPTQFVGRNQQWKHDKPYDEATILPAPPVTNPLLLEKLVAPAGSMDPPVPAITVPSTDGGETVTFSLTFSNSSGRDAWLDSIRDLLPVGATYVDGSSRFEGVPIPDPSNPGGDPAKLSWIGSFLVPKKVGMVPGTATLTFDALLPKATGVYVNSSVGRIGCVQIDTTANTTDDEPATATVTVAEVADLGVSKEKVTEGNPVAGSEVEYLITVKNFGSSTVTEFTLTDSTTPGLIDPAWGSPSKGTYDSSTGKWMVTLGPGESATITLSGTVPGDARGVLKNEATVKVPDGVVDPNEDNDTDEVTNDIDLVADLKVTKVLKAGETVVAGKPVTFVITVENLGTTWVQRFLGTDVSVPALEDLEYSVDTGTYDPGTGVWTADLLDWLETGEKVVFELKGTVPAGATGTLTNTATVATLDGVIDPVDANNTSTVELDIGGEVDLTAFKTGDEKYKAGGVLTFSFVITNLGPSVATGVRVVDDLPTGVASWSWSVTYGGVGSGSGDMGPDSATDSTAGIDKLVNLAVLGTATFTITALTQTGFTSDISNTVVATVGQESATSTFLSFYDGPINPTQDVAGLVVSNDDLCNRLPYVHVLEAETGAPLYEPFLAYEPSFRGGVSIATGDLDGDGVSEIVVGPGRNRIGQIRVFTPGATTFVEMTGYRTLAFGPLYRGGVNVAVGDIDGDGQNEIIAAQGSGLSRVNVFRVNPSESDPVVDTPIRSFVGIPGAYRNGAQVTAGDYGSFVAGQFVAVPDGVDEIAVGSNAGIRAWVRVFDASSTPRLARGFFAIGSRFRGGVTLSTTRWDGDLADDIVVGAGVGGRSVVEVYGGTGFPRLARLQVFSSFARPNAVVNAAALDLDGNGIADNLYGVQGRGGSGGSRGVRRYDMLSPPPGISTLSPTLLPPLRIAPITVQVAGG